MLNLPEDNIMNSYRELVAKLEAITNRPEGQPIPESAQAVEECGAMPIMSGHPEQQNSVTMNVSMNGSGAEGIRDLMAILKNIEDAGEPHHDTDGPADMIVGVEEPEMEEDTDGGFQSATTAPSEEIAGIDAVTRTGNDLASKGDEAPKVNGGGNPFVKEGLLNHLTNLYKEVKERDINEGSMKHMLWDFAERMDREQFIDYTGSEMGMAADEMGEFWDSINGEVDEGIASSIGGAVGSAVQGVKNFASDVKQGYQQATAPAQGAIGYVDGPEDSSFASIKQAPAQGAAPAAKSTLAQNLTGQSAQPAAKPANPEMVKIAQQLAAGTLPQDQAIQQLLKLAGQAKAASPVTQAQAAKPAAGFKDSDW